GPVQIIRRPPLPYPSVDPAIGPSRLYNQAQIRVMISDVPAENHPDGSAVDANDIRLDNIGPYALGTGVNVLGVGAPSYFAHANSDCTNQAAKVCDADFVPNRLAAAPAPTDWPLIDGWLRVETKWADGTWHAVTAEWLSLGFARGLLPPNSAGAG